MGKFLKLMTSREMVTYLIVGVLTTLVSWGTYAILKLFLDVSIPWVMQLAVILRWCAGVLFGFFANRIFVFRSKSRHIFRQFVEFTGARLATLFVEMFIMWLLPTVFHVNDWVSTLLAAVVVTILNYVFSKLFVFSKKRA